MIKKKFFSIHKNHEKQNKGQSLVEMTVVLFILILLLVGMIEVGFTLNRYSILVEAARAGSREGSFGRTDPYIRPEDGTPFTQNDVFFTNVDEAIEGTESRPGGALSPLVLDPAKDDIIITFYRIVDKRIEQKFGPWHKYPSTGHAPTVTDAILENHLNASAPNSGVLVIEIFYDSYQLLKFPIYVDWFPNPIHLHSYAIMPLSLAQPTPTFK